MKIIPIGELRARLYFQQKEEVVNSRGGKEIVWDDVLSAWGKVVVSSGMPYQLTNFQEPKNTHKIYIRYNERVERRMRIRHRDVYFLITAIFEHEIGGKRYMELLVEQQDVVI